MVLDAFLLNTQNYMVWIKGKWNLSVVAIVKEGFGHSRLWSANLLT